VTFIEDSTRLERVGGVGAFLRYRISEPQMNADKRGSDQRLSASISG
jgi:hypothetical protein